ncbi:hypothetical protein RchiOBHm_Chr6g0244291 [Rosa chinensis]|uniref:Uncharacterized protein n=1 Tax=Rosa chinensis TaxID=74649 RepID=A0A2P6PJ05_ROSCH|nr:hypothetical protein RchiOBHm_Chr6g0244291 [Rosa chinensis]
MAIGNCLNLCDDRQSSSFLGDKGLDRLGFAVVDCGGDDIWQSAVAITASVSGHCCAGGGPGRGDNGCCLVAVVALDQVISIWLDRFGGCA